jgi:hypothetical protein
MLLRLIAALFGSAARSVRYCEASGVCTARLRERDARARGDLWMTLR